MLFISSGQRPSKELRPRPNQIFDSPPGAKVQIGKAVESKMSSLEWRAIFHDKIQRETINSTNGNIQIQLMKLMKSLFHFLVFLYEFLFCRKFLLMAEPGFLAQLQKIMFVEWLDWRAKKL